MRTTNKLRRDFQALFPGRPITRGRLLEASLTHPGFMACALFRFQESAYRRNWARASRLIRVLNNTLTGADILPGAAIGPGLVLHHPSGIVIGHGVSIGEDCVILQGVTLGERYSTAHRNHSYPVLGNRVTIGAGAKVLGGLSLGDGCKIGANSVVLMDIPAGRVAVGQPARILETPSDA